MPGRTRPTITVPSEAWPSVAGAIAASEHGGAIHVLAGHSERMQSLILDQPFELEGPSDCSATLFVDQGVVCALGPTSARGSLALRNLTLRSADAPVLTVASTCSVEFCDISGSGVGVQILVGGGARPALVHNVIHGCSVGLCLAGSLHAMLDMNRLEGNSIGVQVIGLELPEGESAAFAPLERTSFINNREADLHLVAPIILHDRQRQRINGSGISNGGARCHAADLRVQRFGDLVCAMTSAVDCAALPSLLRVRGVSALAAVGDEALPSGIGALPRRGRWRTGPLVSTGAGSRERWRDFARLSAPNGQQALLVVSPDGGPPECWTREEAASPEVAAQAFTRWVASALARAEGEASDSQLPAAELGERCLGLLAAGESIGFALDFRLTPSLSQPHFVLFVTAGGEVRMAWFVFATDHARPDQAAHDQHRLVCLLSENLVAPGRAEAVPAKDAGIWMDFAASSTDEAEMAQIIARNTGAFRRAADEHAWELVLAAA